MRLLPLFPPRKPKHLIPNLQSLHLGAYFYNSARGAVTQNLWVCDHQPAVVLVQVQRGGSCPLDADADLVPCGRDCGYLNLAQCGFGADGGDGGVCGHGV